MKNPRLSIIVPCYNEERTVGAMLERLLGVSFPGWEVESIVVNDGSTDGTAAVLAAFASRIQILTLPENRGKGSAVKAGIEAATGDYAIIQDADLECAPEEIPSLLIPLENLAEGERVAVMGSRELHEGNPRRLILSRFGSLFITRLVNLLYGSSLTDVLMGYKLFPRASFGYFSLGGFESEVLFVARLLWDGYRIVEVPVSYTPRPVTAGKKMKYRHGIMTIWRVLVFRLTGR
jgi:glycosyltransferase involved in cell wall biosynthesis